MSADVCDCMARHIGGACETTCATRWDGSGPSEADVLTEAMKAWDALHRVMAVTDQAARRGADVVSIEALRAAARGEATP